MYILLVKEFIFKEDFLIKFLTYTDIEFLSLYYENLNIKE